MNKIWFYMMISSLCVLLINAPSTALSTMIEASSNSLKICIELCCIYAIWMGFIELIEQSGLNRKLSKFLRPVIKKLFKTKDEELENLISINLSSNLLGIGNAATPSAIKAIQKMDDGTGIATSSIIMLLVINTTSIQLIPTTIIGLRSSAGSLTPSDIILPTLISTIITTSIGIFLTILFNKKREKK